MKDNAQRVSSSGTDPTHAVTHLHAIVAAAAGDWPVTDGKDNSIALAQGQDFDAGLHARPLFREDKLAPIEILARLRQQDRDLKRKNMRTIKVLVEAIEVIRAILEKQRSGPRLTRRMAARQKVIMLKRESRLQPHAFVPPIGNGCEQWIERRAEMLHQWWQRIGEIAILAPTEAMALHHHMAAEANGRLIEGCQLVAKGWLDQAGLDRPSLLVKIMRHLVMV